MCSSRFLLARPHGRSLSRYGRPPEQLPSRSQPAPVAGHGGFKSRLDVHVAATTVTTATAITAVAATRLACLGQ